MALRPDVRRQQHDQLPPVVRLLLEPEEVAQGRNPGQARQPLLLIIVFVFHQAADDQRRPSGTITLVVSSAVVALGRPSPIDAPLAPLGMDLHPDHAVAGDERAQPQQGPRVQELDLPGWCW